MGPPLTRRQFLALPVPFFVSAHLVGVPWLGSALAAEPRVTRVQRRYEAQVGVLFDLLRFSVAGQVTEEIDRAAGRYQVTVAGGGIGVAGQTDSVGVIRGGRFLPVATTSVSTIRGRENRGHVAYDLERRVVRFRSVSHTLFLGRRRELDDTVAVPGGVHVDDLLSAELNFAANVLDRDPDGAYRVTVARRARAEEEGADDVAAGGYRAELKTVRIRPDPQPDTGRIHARVDLTGFSSWARAASPAQVAFGPDRHLESVRSSLMLGTTFTLRLTPVS
jgi:hypothetical protein